MSDPRSLSLVLYHAIASKIRLHDELTPSQARTILVEALTLLPDYAIAESDVPHILRIRDRAGHEVIFNIQDAVDSLLVMHQDFRRLEDLDQAAPE